MKGLLFSSIAIILTTGSAFASTDGYWNVSSGNMSIEYTEIDGLGVLKINDCEYSTQKQEDNSVTAIWNTAAGKTAVCS